MFAIQTVPPGPIPHVGVGAVDAIQSTLPEWTSYLFAAATLLGEAWLFVPVLALAYWFGDAERIGPLFGLVFGGLALVVVFKWALAQPRPPAGPMLPAEAAHESVRGAYAWATEADGYGFPSGHAAGAALAWGGLAGALQAGSRRTRVGVAATLIAIAAVSRVALGVHYAADVIAGILVGLAMLAAWHVGRDRVGRPVVVALLAGVGCAAVPIALGIGGSEPFYAAGATAGGLATWLAVGPPDRRLAPNGPGVAAGAVGVVWFLVVGIAVGSVLDGAVGSVAMTAAMAAAIFSWPDALRSVSSRVARARPEGR